VRRMVGRKESRRVEGGGGEMEKGKGLRKNSSMGSEVKKILKEGSKARPLPGEHQPGIVKKVG